MGFEHDDGKHKSIQLERSARVQENEDILNGIESDSRIVEATDVMLIKSYDDDENERSKEGAAQSSQEVEPETNDEVKDDIVAVHNVHEVQINKATAST